MLLIPQVLDVPEKMMPLITEFNAFRYFLIEGGRGGGKSHTIARWILYLSEQYRIRTVCGRETQNSIAESVHSVFADIIRNYNLNFEVLKDKITHRTTGSTIMFRGFREQGAVNIRGLEGVDIVWIDEAQAISKMTIDTLIPTIIRKESAKIIFSMNRHVHNDPVYVNFFGHEECLHININYYDNKYCSQALIKEATKCKERSIKDYEHIWLGLPLERTEDAVFLRSELQAVKTNKYGVRPGYGYRIGGFDIARFGDDKCAAVIIQQMGALNWEVIHQEQWEHRDLTYTSGKIMELGAQFTIDRGIIDEDGIGAGPLDNLKHGRGLDKYLGFRNPSISYQDNPYYANNRTANTYRLKDMVSKGHIHIPHDEILSELETLRYCFDHNQRRVLMSKDKMRKEGFKSPNLADALIMAISLVDEIKQRQDNQYVSRETRTNPDLFAIAGVR